MLGCNWLLYKIELTSACCTCVSVFLRLYSIKAKSAKEKQQHKTRTQAVMDTQLHGTVLSPFFTAVGLIGELGRWPETNHVYGRDLLICTIKMRRFIVTKRVLCDLNQTGMFFRFLWDLHHCICRCTESNQEKSDIVLCQVCVSEYCCLQQRLNSLTRNKPTCKNTRM